VSSHPPPPPRRTSTPQQRTSTRPSVKTQQATPRQPTSVPPTPTAPAMPAPPLPPTPTSTSSMSAPPSTFSPAQAQATATLKSMLASFPYPLPPVNTDRLAAIRAAKIAILNGGQPGQAQQLLQQQQYPTPGWPAPNSNNSFGSGGPSGGGGGARK
jgi:hypothetical protein